MPCGVGNLSSEISVKHPNISHMGYRHMTPISSHHLSNLAKEHFAQIGRV